MRSRLLVFLLVLACSPLSYGTAQPIFGPKQYKRTPGPPELFSDTFQNCEPAAQYQVGVINGNSDGTNRISSAKIVLNGKEIVGPNELNQNVSRISTPVTVLAQNQLTVILASIPGSFITVDVECVSNCLNVQLTSPSPDTAINQARANVGGTVTSSADEVGVAVNGVVAFARNGQFVAPNVPLVLGTNTLTATATNVCLNQAASSEQITVASLTPQAVTLTAAPTSGLAPLSVTFTSTVSSPNAISQYQWDFNGDGVIETSGPTLSQASNIYTQPGLYLATLTAIDSVGNRLTAQIPIQVLSATGLTTLIQARWSSLVDALTTRNTSAAFNLFQPGVADQFQAVFAKLGNQLPEAASGLGNLSLLAASGGLAEFVTVRTQQGNTRAYFVYFMQDSNGLWKIIAM